MSRLPTEMAIGILGGTFKPFHPEGLFVYGELGSSPE